MAAAVAYVYKTGATLLYGDAESHLDIARRVVDSRTPGWDQLGTAWLPLPHLLMIPLVRNDWMWRTGLAGGITSGLCTALAATFLFAGTHRIFESKLAGAAATAVFLLNPNTLYLGSIPMTEPAWFASLFALFYFTVRFGETRGWGSLLGAGLAACAGTLTRYEAWFLLPFVAIYILVAARRWTPAIVFCLIAGSGPLLWLAHNRWYFGDPLYFYRGPWSALAIQGKSPYPGRGDWRVAAKYFFAAGRLVAGWPGLSIAALGTVAVLSRQTFWPFFLFLLAPAFYVWSIHSSGTPIFVPGLEPHSFYNTRYAMAFLPLIALGAAGLARFGKIPAAAVVAIALVPFPIHWNEQAITWQEADVNSRGRLAWTAQAADFLRAAAGPHETFFTGYGLTAIYRTVGVPLRDTLSGDNNPQFLAAEGRPDLALWEDWAVAMGGDPVQSTLDKARLHGPRFELSDRIIVKGQPVIEIYHHVYDIPLR
ncbi:MAG: glycosyltransferase family 39 protein [Bryobacteraceae bacterium]|jgi:hypothetical protein